MFPFALAAGALGGLFGGGDDEPTQTQPQYTRQQRELLRRLMRLGNQTNTFANSAPGSYAGERQGLAQTLGLQAQAARRGREGLFSGMSPTSMQSPSTARALSNVGQAETAQQSGIYGDAMQQGYARRGQARQSLTGIYGTAGGIAGNPAQPGMTYMRQGSGLAGMLGGLGQMWGQQQYGQGQGDGSIYGTTIAARPNQDPYAPPWGR